MEWVIPVILVLLIIVGIRLMTGPWFGRCIHCQRLDWLHRLCHTWEAKNCEDTWEVKNSEAGDLEWEKVYFHPMCEHHVANISRGGRPPGMPVKPTSYEE